MQNLQGGKYSGTCEELSGNCGQTTVRAVAIFMRWPWNEMQDAARQGEGFRLYSYWEATAAYFPV